MRSRFALLIVFRFAVLLCVMFAAACSTRDSAPSSHPSPQSTRALPDDNLNAVVWVQRAVEYRASALQAFRAAQQQLDAALETPTWTAAIEQTAAAGLPPAVVLDVDETVLDNSYYQARMVRNATTYSEQTWSSWVEERQATAIPGAVEFTRYAAERRVAIFFVTNRTKESEPPTRANLSALGFPLDPEIDTVLTRGERPEWQASTKGPRRAYIGEKYRILLLIGDDLGDFVADAGGTTEQRAARTAPYDDRWGRQWIMVPNPTYGSWERAVIGASTDPTEAKRRALLIEPR